MTEEYKRVLDLLPTANRENLKIMADVLYRVIDYLEESVKWKDEAIKWRDEAIKRRDDIIKAQRTEYEFEKIFKGRCAGEA